MSYHQQVNIVIAPNDTSTVGAERKYELNHNLSHFILVEEKSLGINAFINNMTTYLNNNQKPDTDLDTEDPGIPEPHKDPAEEVLAKQKQKQKEAQGKEQFGFDSSQILFNYLNDTEVPIVSIVIKGGYGCSKLVKTQILKHIPVVVLKGSGGLADLLAFVDIEIRDRSMNSWDVEFVESYVKPELTIRIMESFPDLRNNSLLCNQFRMTILDIVRESRDTKTGQNYLTMINMLDVHSCDLENLTEHLLFALFRSQRTEMKADAQTKAIQQSERIILKDLSLCIDWNCPEMARREVLAKQPNFNINSPETRKLFEESLIRPNRSKFVDLFLTQKFRLRSYVPKRLRKLFRVIHFNKFYVNVCWEGILRRSKQEIWQFITEDKAAKASKIAKSSNQKPKTSMWHIYFNQLVEGVTGITELCDPEELSIWAGTEMWFPLSEREAERKSLELLVLWALFDNRRDLVHTFWKHSDQPIQLAIVIAIANERLSWYVAEETVANRLTEDSQLFVSFACELLDIVYKDSPYRAEEVLNESTKDWNYKTPVDMAAVGKFKQFFSHESVQRWLTLLMNGSIEIRDTKYGFFRLPNMIKLIFSAYLVFPAYFWIKPLRFETQLDKNQERLLLEEDEGETDLNAMASNMGSPSLASSQASSSVHITGQTTPIANAGAHNAYEHKEPSTKGIALTKEQSTLSPIWWITAIYEVWSAPITKFWNFQFFYTFYLAIFSLATLYPKCGHFYLDVIITVWTSLLIVDNVRQVYITSRRNSRANYVLGMLQIVFQLSFVIYFVKWRLHENSSSPSDAFDVKVFMSFALIHAYYVLLTVFLPISATLGPLLYRLKIMIFVDFLNFIRLSILVMISFGIVIQALFYPDADVTLPTFRMLFHRTFFSLFLTPKDELDAHLSPTYAYCEERMWTDQQIEKLTQHEDFCSASDYNDHTCPNTGFFQNVFLMAYFVLLKLLLLTVLYAIFASSAARLTADTDSIWRFQRYGLVMDFVTRPPLPPPINFFYYIYWITRFLVTFIINLICSKDKDYFVSTINFKRYMALKSRLWSSLLTSTENRETGTWVLLRTIASGKDIGRWWLRLPQNTGFRGVRTVRNSNGQRSSAH